MKVSSLSSRGCPSCAGDEGQDVCGSQEVSSFQGVVVIERHQAGDKIALGWGLVGGLLSEELALVSA